MSHAYAYNTAKNYSVRIHGWNIPKGALYGTFTGYKAQIKYVVPQFPQTVHSALTVYVYSNERWFKAPYDRYKRLYNQVYQYIHNLNLIGACTRYAIRNVQLPTNVPYGRKQRITALKNVNKTYYDRGSSGHPIYGDMCRNAAGEKEYAWRSPKTITYGQTP